MIADDHSLFRDGLKQLLRMHSGIEITGEAVNGHDLLKKLAETPADVILTDIQMPVMDGAALTREVIRRKMGSRVLALSTLQREEPILKMLEAGALGYVSKTADGEEIIEAIHTVYRSKPYFCKTITEMLTGIVARSYQPPVNPEYSLSEKEKEIMRLICQERTSKEIADRLHLSKRTVEGYRTRIMDKISAKSVAGVIRYAMEKGVYRKPVDSPQPLSAPQRGV